MTSRLISARSLPPAQRLDMMRLARLPGLLPAAAILVLLVAWELSTRLLDIPAFVLPGPSRIVEGFSSIELGRWATHVWSTLRVALMGYVLSILVALPMAVILARSEMLSRAVSPLLVVIQSTPIVAVAPILIVVLGAGDLPRVVITCLITFFPLVVSTMTGLLATPPELIELSRSLRAPAWREITQIRLLFAVPYIFSALRISITLAVIGAVVAEFVAADTGLGYFIQFSTSMFQIPQAWAGLSILVALSLGLYQSVGLVQRLLFPWSLERRG